MAKEGNTKRQAGKGNLLIVESPHKAQTIGKFLGGDFTVASSMGHIRDLPKRELGVSPKDGFRLTYEVSKAKVVDQLRNAARNAQTIYLASDPDREGEAIAWHLREVLGGSDSDPRFRRVKYNEITPRAVKAAIAEPGEIDMNLVDAQQARRAIDRIVGYKISPFVRRNVRGGSAAGRVQSVALRLICEREDEIEAFKPVPYWVIGAMLKKGELPPFFAKLVRIDGKKAEIGSDAEAERIYNAMLGSRFSVESVTTREVSRHALPPFITSSLQRAASSVLGFTPSRTMSIAQKLYEGVEIGEGDGPSGLITYMRTDGTFVAREAQDAALEFISANYGAEYRPERPNFYKSGASAQEAHEAIRPTDVTRTPAAMAKWLEPAELKLYDLIWRRFVASQMTGAKFRQRTVLFTNEQSAGTPPATGIPSLALSATATDVVFQGFLKVMSLDVRRILAMRDGKDDEIGQDEDDAQDAAIPELASGEGLDTASVKSDRKETKPPPRYSEATLIDTLEKNGIGRPSTYATIMETIIDHKYAVRDRKTLVPTQVGRDVVKFLVAKFPALFDKGFTARMEESLDDVADGSSKVGYTTLLDDFYQKFTRWMDEGKDPPADSEKVGRVLAALAEIREWLPPEKRGRRTFDDHRLADSIRLQFEEGKKPISANQFNALLGIARRHRLQIHDFENRFAEFGDIVSAKQANPETPKETCAKLEMLVAIPGLGERRSIFLHSLMSQLKSGRNLSPRQIEAVDSIFASSLPDIPGGRELAERNGIKVDDIPESKRDDESAPLIAALAAVTKWDDPVKRRGRKFDDEKFFDSVRRQFEDKGVLSDKQRAALRRMVSRYAGQIPPDLMPGEAGQPSAKQ